MKRRALPACAVTVRKFWLVTPILMEISCRKLFCAGTGATLVDRNNVTMINFAVIANAQSVRQMRAGVAKMCRDLTRLCHLNPVTSAEAWTGIADCLNCNIRQSVLFAGLQEPDFGERSPPHRSASICGGRDHLPGGR